MSRVTVGCSVPLITEYDRATDAARDNAHDDFRNFARKSVRALMDPIKKLRGHRYVLPVTLSPVAAAKM